VRTLTIKYAYHEAYYTNTCTKIIKHEVVHETN